MNLTNPYKRLDVFRCSQDAHHGFDGRVSAWHVMKEKGCWPEGCLYFLWHCALLAKGKPCIRGFSVAGRECKGCTWFQEDKVHLQPSLLLDDEAYQAFLDEADRFDEWLARVQYRRLDIAGRIKTVKPWFEQILSHKNRQIRLRGFLLVFKWGFVGQDAFSDTFYVRISDRLMKEFQFVPKMKVEFKGEVREDRGRIVIHKPGSVDILTRGWGRPWTRDRALVAVRTATKIESQPPQCLGCHHGALADVLDVRHEQEERYRNLFCLKGIADWRNCYLNPGR